MQNIVKNMALWVNRWIVVVSVELVQFCRVLVRPDLVRAFSNRVIVSLPEMKTASPEALAIFVPSRVSDWIPIEERIPPLARIMVALVYESPLDGV